MNKIELTKCQLEIAQVLSTGKTRQQVANERHLALKTIDTHLTGIFDKIEEQIPDFKRNITNLAILLLRSPELFCEAERTRTANKRGVPKALRDSLLMSENTRKDVAERFGISLNDVHRIRKDLLKSGECYFPYLRKTLDGAKYIH